MPALRAQAMQPVPVLPHLVQMQVPVQALLGQQARAPVRWQMAPMAQAGPMARAHRFSSRPPSPG